MDIRLVKAHGDGNDFLILDERLNPDLAAGLTPAQVRRLCDRSNELGGADGLLRVRCAGPTAHLRVSNADGSEASISVNGLRCAGRYAFEEAGTDRVTVRVGGIEVPVQKAEGPAPDVPACSAKVPGICFVDGGEGLEVRVPNPHWIRVGEGLDDGRLAEWAQSRDASGRQAVSLANLTLVDGFADGRALVKTFERGVGPTSSCASAACAVAALGFRTGESAARQSLEVISKGGLLRCRVEADGEDPERVAVEISGSACWIEAATVRWTSGGLERLSGRRYGGEIEAYERFRGRHEEAFETLRQSRSISLPASV